MHKGIHSLINLAILVIGIYLIVTNWGPITPPLLSGIAFTLLGVAKNCPMCKK